MNKEEDVQATTPPQTSHLALQPEQLQALNKSFECDYQKQPDMPICEQYNQGVMAVCGGSITDPALIGFLHVAQAMHTNGHIMLEIEGLAKENSP